MVVTKESSSNRNRKPRKKVSLPSKPNQPPKDLAAYSVLLYGEKGIGKSELASNFPLPITMMFEPGRFDLSIRMIPEPDKHGRIKEADLLDWPSFVDYLEAISNDKSIETVIIDTVDLCYRACYNYICQEVYEVEQPDDLGKGYASSGCWNAIRTEFTTKMNALRFVKTPIFISHSRDRETEQPLQKTDSETGEKIKGGADRILAPTATGQAWDCLKTICNMVWAYLWIDKERVLVLRGNDYIRASIGPKDHFLQPDGEPLEALTLPTDHHHGAEDAYQVIMDGWNNKLWDRNYTPPPTAAEKRKAKAKKKKAKSRINL